jgi:hypothetical protein
VAIHQAAVMFYSRDEEAGSPLGRAEELYHRLMLGQGAWQLDDRWRPGVEPFLATAIEEIPAAQRVWLAQRMSIDLPVEIYAMADHDEWERLTGRRVVRLLRHGDFEGAAIVLAERSERSPGSPLIALEARVLMALGRHEEALVVLERGLAGFPPAGDPGRSSELLWLYAQVAGATGRESDCVDALRKLLDVAKGLPTRIPEVQGLTELLGRLEIVWNATDGELRERLAIALQSIPPHEVDAERSLIRLALVRLGSAYPRTAERLLGDVYGEFAYMVRVGQVDVTSAMPVAREAFARSAVDEFRLMSSPEYARGYSLVDELTALVQRISPDSAAPLRLETAALDGIYSLMRAEGATLAGSTLAGVEASREQWESEGSAEASA